MTMDTNKMIKMAILIALAIALMLLIRFPLIPSAPYLEYEPADVPALIAAFMYGPVSGFIIAVAVALLQGTLVSSASGPIGIVMNIVSSGAFVFVAGGIYTRFRTLKGAVVGLILGSISMAIVMVPANLVLTPLYTGAPREVVLGLILPVIIPFNLLKAGINSAITVLVYKSVRRLFHPESGHLTKHKERV